MQNILNLTKKLIKKIIFFKNSLNFTEICQKYTKIGLKGIFEKFSFFICKIAIFDLKTYKKINFFQKISKFHRSLPKTYQDGIKRNF